MFATTTTRIGVGIALGILTSVSTAGQETRVEDFDDGGAPGFDPGFNHALSQFAELLDFNGNFVIGMAPGGDDITFNLAGGESVIDASVTILDFCGSGCSTVEFVGTNGSALIGNTAVGLPETVSTDDLGLGEITSISLFSFEGFFDDVTITVDTGGVACVADLTGDDEVGFGDVLAIIGGWGCSGTCPEDVNGNGVVDFADILAALSVWGPCSPPTEACCIPAAGCSDLTVADCMSAGGTAQGPDTTCSGTTCP